MSARSQKTGRDKRDFPGRSARKSEGLREAVTGDRYFNEEGGIVRRMEIEKIVLIYIYITLYIYIKV